MQVPAGVDTDKNHVDDRLDSEIVQRALNGTQGEPVNVTVMLSGDTVAGAANAFGAQGVFLKTDLWRYALYGFGGADSVWQNHWVRE